MLESTMLVEANAPEVAQKANCSPPLTLLPLKNQNLEVSALLGRLKK